MTSNLWQVNKDALSQNSPLLVPEYQPLRRRKVTNLQYDPRTFSVQANKQPTAKQQLLPALCHPTGEEREGHDFYQGTEGQQIDSQRTPSNLVDTGELPARSYWSVSRTDSSLYILRSAAEL